MNSRKLLYVFGSSLYPLQTKLKVEGECCGHGQRLCNPPSTGENRQSGVDLFIRETIKLNETMAVKAAFATATFGGKY